MKIEIAKSDLDTALSVVSLAVEKASDISGHYLFKVTPEGGVTLNGYAARKFASAPLKCTLTRDDENEVGFTVERERLMNWMKTVPDGLLTLTREGKSEVELKGKSSGKIRVASLDPTKFHSFDKTLAAATPIGSVSAVTLLRAISLVRGFVDVDDTNKPEICQLEAIDGIFWATDRTALSAVEVLALPTLNTRIPGKETGDVKTFLSILGASNVEVLSADQVGSQNACTIFRRDDGAYFSVGRPVHTFPTLRVDRDAAEEAGFVLDIADFTKAVGYMVASAPEGHKSLRFQHVDGKVVVSWPCAAGGADDTHELTIHGEVRNGTIFDSGLIVDVKYIFSIAKTFDATTLDLGVVRRGKGGFLFARRIDDATDGNNKYYVAIVCKG